MEELKEQIQEQILKDLKIEDKLFLSLCDAVEDEYADLWTRVEDVSKIRILLLEAVRLFMSENQQLTDLSNKDRIRFQKTVYDLLWSSDSLLQRKKESQLKIIGIYGVEEWISKIKRDIAQIKSLILRYSSGWEGKFGEGEKTIARIYDRFSENTRNNDLKVQSLILLIEKDKSKKLFEIGFGTCPLLRRLWKLGYTASGIDSNRENLSVGLSKPKYAKGKLIIKDFEKYKFKKYLLPISFDVIFMEAGVLIFTPVDGALFCEAYFKMNYGDILEFLKKVYSGLSIGGMLLLGIQDLKRADLGEGYVFDVKRIQYKNNMNRELFLYKDGNLIFNVRQRKKTLTYEEFSKMALGIGFKNIYVESHNQWIVLEK